MIPCTVGVDATNGNQIDYHKIRDLLDLVSGAKTPIQPNLPKAYRIYLQPYIVQAICTPEAIVVNVGSQAVQDYRS